MREFTKEQLDGEKWKPMFGYKEYCEASTLGRIKALQRKTIGKDGKTKKIKEKILRLGYYSNGYEQFSISINSKRHTGIVHRLIAKTFIDNPDNLPLINHKNGIKDDNRIKNLEWCTRSYNGKHAFRELGRQQRDMAGEKNTNSVLTEEDVMTIRKLYGMSKCSTTETAKLYGVKSACISKIVTGRTWKHLL